MPSGHVTGGAPPGTGKDYQAVLLLTRVLGESKTCFAKKYCHFMQLLYQAARKPYLETQVSFLCKV